MKFKEFFKYIFFTLAFAAFTAIPVLAQPVEAPNKTDAQGRKQGLWVGYYPTDTLKYRGTFKNNLPIDTLERFDEDGFLVARLIYRKGNPKVADAQIFYTDNGGLMAEGKYVEQERDSVWFFYDLNGHLVSRENYKNGKRHGEVIVYYATGSVSEKANYRNGVKNGKWEQYFENGNPKLSATVMNGIKYDGIFVSYYPDGSKRDSGRYVNGLRESSWYHFNADGSIRVIYVYRAGEVKEEHRRNGVFTKYFPNDIKRSEYTYEDGKKNGPFKEYYEKGKWVTGIETDKFGITYPVQRLEDTQVKREGNYKNDKLDGEIITYTEKGKIKKKEVYQNGILRD